ncbi:ras-related and estrogen-regulated growth inhibitor-like protein [Cladorrhinum samala]|uniref:small monomeric GTPase n=1 Tax=Cladorrhinum samala TaxID=585594 RepID=A0AAV9HY18_9PEZI|nr:ras-related and estrogen-regulated growth inhibitor-like protein [Cladorrhinum samala]
MTTNSLVFTPEEAKYLKAILSWEDDDSTDGGSGKRKPRPSPRDVERRKHQSKGPQEKPAGEFRVLVIGGRATGKTAILTRVWTFSFLSTTFFPFLSSIPTNNVTLKNPITTTASPLSPSSANRHHHRHCQPLQYTIDALEFPSQHLSSDPLIEQALAATDAAVLLYSVTDRASFKLACSLAEFIREHFSSNPRPRVYALLLVGNKSDAGQETSEQEGGVGVGGVGGGGGGGGGGEEAARQVTWTVGSKAATTMGMGTGNMGMAGNKGAGIGFLEVSCRTGENVNEVFPAVGREVLRLRRLRRQQEEQEQKEREKKMGAATTMMMMMNKKNGSDGQERGTVGGGGGAGIARGKKVGLLRRMVRGPFWRRQGGSVVGEKAF